jgi:hypothetical protein
MRGLRRSTAARWAMSAVTFDDWRRRHRDFSGDLVGRPGVINRARPLIWHALNDEVMMMAEPRPESVDSHRIADIECRADASSLTTVGSRFRRTCSAGTPK